MKKLLLPALLGSLGLSGCASAPKSVPVRPATIQAIGNAQELDDALALLEQGDEPGARRKLEAMAKRDPADPLPQRLLESMTAEPRATLGSRAFDYRVVPGDTLPELAQRFLGDRLKFYLLARYNGVAVPASIQPGQTLRIPGVAPASLRPATREARPRSTRPAPTPKAPARTSTPAKPSAPATNPRRAGQLRAAGLAALNKGQVGQAVGLLQQALSLDPGNVATRRDLERARRIQQTVRTRR